MERGEEGRPCEADPQLLAVLANPRKEALTASNSLLGASSCAERGNTDQKVLETVSKTGASMAQYKTQFTASKSP